MVLPLLGSKSFLVFLRDPFLHLYFLLFINNLPDCLSFSRIAMFADDTKCYNVIRFQDDVTHLQHNLYKALLEMLYNELSYLRNSRKRRSDDRSYVFE